MPKIRMIVFNDDAEVLGHKDFHVPSGVQLKDPVMDALKAVVMDKFFKDAFEVVLDHRGRLAARLEQVIEAVDLLQDVWGSKQVDGMTVLNALLRLNLTKFKALLSESTLIDVPMFERGRTWKKEPPMLTLARDAEGNRHIVVEMEAR